MRFLKQNTATRVTVGPFLDVTDAVTPETALTVTGCHLTLMVDDAGVPTLVLDADATASGGNNDMVHVTNDDAGFYDLELTAAQTNYVGRAMLAIIDTDVHLPVFHEFMVVPANVYDSLFGTDYLQVDSVQQGGTSLTARDIGASVLLSSGTGTGQISLSSGAVTAGTVSDKTGYSLTATTGLGNQTANITGNLSGSVGSVTGAVGSVTGAVGSVGSGGITSASFATDAITAAAIAADAIGASELAADAATEIGTAVWATASRTLTANTNFNDPTAASIADAVWDEARNGHTDAGSFGQGVASVQGNVTGSVASVTGAVGSVTSGVSLADDAITAAKFDESTAFPLRSDVDTDTDGSVWTE